MTTEMIVLVGMEGLKCSLIIFLTILLFRFVHICERIARYFDEA